MRAIDFTTATQAKLWNPAALAAPIDFQDSGPAPALDFHVAEADAPLHLRVLRTARQREELATLRKHAPMGVEDDLGAGLMPYETLRDDMGFVTAMYRGSKLVATMRFVPSGLRLTAAERLPDGIGEAGNRILGAGNWEVGRLIVSPDERSPELLQDCLTLALRALIEERDVDHFYAIATPVMARLWRRFGMRPAAPLRGASGRDFMLVAGHVSAVATALEVPLPARRGVAPVAVPHEEETALAA